MRPQRQHYNDAGFDLSTKTSVVIYPGETVFVPTGYCPDKHDIPDGSVGLVFARSSLSKKGLLLANGVGVIDAGYEGEVMVALWNMSTDTPVVLEEHERIAQIVIVRLEGTSALYSQPPIQADKKRGKGGFGSTGRIN
nr:MAG TPA: dUTPase [Caudoviricetes sp.]